MNSEMIDWIKEAINRLDIKSSPAPEADARRIIQKAQDTFVSDHPRAWWMSLKGKPEIFDSRTHSLGQILPSHEQGYWFIPEAEVADLPVFELSRSQIEELLKECPFFEYYIIQKDFNWL